MKLSFKLLLAAGAALVLAAACEKYDDSELRGKISTLEGRIATLEDLVKTANKNIADLQTLTVSQRAGRYLNGHTSVSFSFCTDPNEMEDEY